MDQKRGSAGGVSEEKSTPPPRAEFQSDPPPPSHATTATDSTPKALGDGKEATGTAASASGTAAAVGSPSTGVVGTVAGGRRQESGAGEEHEEEEIVIEQPLLTIKEVFVYKVPPLRASSGHRAEEWGLASPVFSGESERERGAGGRGERADIRRCEGGGRWGAATESAVYYEFCTIHQTRPFAVPPPPKAARHCTAQHNTQRSGWFKLTKFWDMCRC